MKKLKVVKLDMDYILFDNGVKLFSEHEQDCCEQHYLDWSDLDLSDFEGLEFDLSNESFFNRIDGYGIELIPIKGHSIKIPGYGHNNGYYSEALGISISNGKDFSAYYDISDCQIVYEG